MPMHFSPIFQCSFCAPEGSGHILVDAAALTKERTADNEHSAPTGEKTEERIFLFNSGREQPGPCEHLMVMSGTIAWGSPADEIDMITFDWDFDFDVDSPRLREIRNEDEDESDIFFWDVLYDDGPSPIRPTTRCRLEFIDTRWRDFSDRQRVDRYYAMTGRAVFVENIDALIGELHQRGVEYQKWLASGGGLAMAVADE